MDTENLATQDGLNDGSQVVDGAADGGANDGSSDQPFLQVNERTIYRTPEEAKAGYAEAQKAITSLSGLKSAVEEYVGKGNASPEVIKQFLQELVQRRKEAEAATKKVTPSSGDAEDPRFEGKSQDEIRQIKAADKWFEEQAKKRGYVTQESIKELQEKLAAIKAAPEKQFAAANDEAVLKGREWLDAQLAQAKIALTDAEIKKLTARIGAYVDGDEELVGRWQQAVRSGNRAEQQAVIKEAAEFALPLVKPGSSLKPPTAQTKTKAQLAARTPRPMPQQGVARKPGENQRPSALAQPKGIRSKDLDAKAMAFLEEALAGQE